MDAMRRTAIAEGVTVVVTELGARRHPRLRGRIGIVTGRSRQYGRTWLVRFEGNSSAQAIHENYINLLQDTSNDQHGAAAGFAMDRDAGASPKHTA
jgi:hypothetical protein